MERQSDPLLRNDRRNETLEEVVGKLLWEKKKRIAVAESCTGGRIAARMTRVPGSSRYFDAACVVYSNRSKEEFLGVPKDLLIERGAVSPEVAVAMAEGIRKRTGADLSLGVTGIAGPEGGTPSKPVGLVYIGFSDGKEATVERHLFQGDREAVQAQATERALERIKIYFRESE